MNASSFSNIASKVMNEIPSLNLPKNLPSLPSASNLVSNLPIASNLVSNLSSELPSVSNLANLPNSNTLIDSLITQSINNTPNIEKIQNLIQTIENSNLPKEIVKKILDDLKAILGMLRNNANALQLDIEKLMSNVIKILVCSGILLLLLLLTVFIVVIIIFKVLSQKYALGATIIFVAIAGFITISTLLKTTAALKNTFSNTIAAFRQDEAIINKIL